MRNFNPKKLKNKKGFMNIILKLDTLIAPKVIIFFYWLFLIGLVVAFFSFVIFGLVTMVERSFFEGLVMIVFAPIMILAYWLVIRIATEIIIIAFKNNEYLKKISEK